MKKSEWSVELLNKMTIEEFEKFLEKGVVLPPTTVKKLEKEKKIFYHRADINHAFMGLGVKMGIWEKKLQDFKVRKNPDGDHLPPVAIHRKRFSDLFRIKIA